MMRCPNYNWKDKQRCFVSTLDTSAVGGGKAGNEKGKHNNKMFQAKLVDTLHFVTFRYDTKSVIKEYYSFQNGLSDYGITVCGLNNRGTAEKKGFGTIRN